MKSAIGSVGLGAEAEVAVGEDALELAVPVDHGQPGDAVAGHQLERLADQLVGRMVTGSTIIPDSDRFTMSTSSAWWLDGHVAVDHAEAAVLRHGDRHAVPR